MARRAPPLHVLFAFEAVARHSSFSKAADELSVTRSAISHRIQLLEEMLGRPAFERGPRLLALTPTGAAYLITVKKALAALEDVAAQTGDRPRKKRIAMTMPPTFGRMVILPHITKFLNNYHDIEISIELSMSQLDYRAGDTDLDIRFGTGVHPGRECKLLLAEKIFLVASPRYIEDNRLQEPKDLVRVQLLRSKLEPWRPWFDAAGLDWEEPDVGHRFEDLSLLYHAAANGLGVALARESLARPLLDAGALVPLFDIATSSPYAYHLVYDQVALRRPEVVSLIEWLLQWPRG